MKLSQRTVIQGIVLLLLTISLSAEARSLFSRRSGGGGSSTQTIVSVTPSSGTFTGGASSGTVIASVVVTMSPASPPFSGTLSLTGTDAGTNFTLSSATLPSQLLTNGTLSTGVYNHLNIVATQTGISPFTQAVTVTGYSPSVAAIAWTTPRYMQWHDISGIEGYADLRSVGGTGSSGKLITTAYAATWPPSTGSHSFSLNGTDASNFAINASTGDITLASDVAAGDYGPTKYDYTANTGHTLNLVVDTNTRPLNIHVMPAGSPELTLSNLTTGGNGYFAHVGDTVRITVTNSPNTDGSDLVTIYHPTIPNKWNTYFALGSGVHNTTFDWTIPAIQSEDYQYFAFVLQNGNTLKGFANANTLTVYPDITYAAPTGTNAFTTPPGFSPPGATYEVCNGTNGGPSGCAYSKFGAAITASESGPDYAKILVHKGVYADDCYGTINQTVPHHLWIQGTGGDFPAIGWGVPCVSKGTIVWGFGYPNAQPGDALYIDNIMFAYGTQGGPEAGVYLAGAGKVTLRNVVIRDNSMGTISPDYNPSTSDPAQNLGGDYTFLNVRLARNGGFEGPAHNIYLGAGTCPGEVYTTHKDTCGPSSTFTLDHSISEQASVGYEVKTRMAKNIINCNILRGAIDQFAADSGVVDFAEGREDYLTNNLIYQGTFPVSNNSTMVLWSSNRYTPPKANGVQIPEFLSSTNNYFIQDYDGHLSPPWYYYGTAYYIFNICKILNSTQTGFLPCTLPPPDGSQIVGHGMPWTGGTGSPWTLGPGNKYVFNSTSTPTGFLNPYVAWFDGTDIAVYPKQDVDTSGNIIIASGENVTYPTRTAAGITNNHPNGSTTYPVPTGCTGTPIGNVSVP